jgi:hypothetical protein
MKLTWRIKILGRTSLTEAGLLMEGAEAQRKTKRNGERWSG